MTPPAPVKSATFYLRSGEEIQAEPKALDGSVFLVDAGGQPRKLPLSGIVAVQSGGDLTNGPFEASRLREILGLAAPAAEIATAELQSESAPDVKILPDRDRMRREPPEPIRPDSTGPAGAGAFRPAAPESVAAARSLDAYARQPRDGIEFYRYGTMVSMPNMAPIPGQAFGGGTGSVKKVFSACVYEEGKQKCDAPRWIGIFGEDLSTALSQVPEAREVANRIETTTEIQVISLVALPVFLGTAIGVTNGPKDEHGNVSTHIGPASVIFFGLTGAAFANYIGWNIYEGHLARKAIRLYNETVGVKVSAAPAPGGAVFAADVTF